MKSGIRDRTKVKCGIRFASKFGTRSRFSFLIVAACSSHQQHAIPATHTYRKLSFLKVHNLQKAKPCNEWSFRSPKSEQHGGKGKGMVQLDQKILKAVCLHNDRLFQSTQEQFREWIRRVGFYRPCVVHQSKTLMVFRLIIWRSSCSVLHWRKLVLTTLVHQY